MKLASMFIKASAEYFRGLPQNLNLYKELPCMKRKQRFYRDNNPMARFFSYLRIVNTTISYHATTTQNRIARPGKES